MPDTQKALAYCRKNKQAFYLLPGPWIAMACLYPTQCANRLLQAILTTVKRNFQNFYLTSLALCLEGITECLRIRTIQIQTLHPGIQGPAQFGPSLVSHKASVNPPNLPMRYLLAVSLISHSSISLVTANLMDHGAFSHQASHDFRILLNTGARQP